MTEMTLEEKINSYVSTGALPMHMPGHKRNAEAFPWLAGLGCGIDITEIDGFDDLNEPRGIFAELEARAARLFGADESVCLVNGSTGGILAAVFAALEHGGELLMSRASHKSVYNAAEIVGARVRYVMPRFDAETGVTGSVSPDAVREALGSYPGVRLVVITSPTYDGVVSDVGAIAEICHERGALLLVDEAHGAHLGFGGFPENAVSLGADIAVASLHKTLPSLTQTAILHLRGGRIDARAVRRAAAMFGTSSPSYILSASIDGCISFLEAEGEEYARRWHDALGAFRADASSLNHLRILGGSDAFYALDPSKITVLTSGTELTGPALADILRRRFNIEPEMVSADSVLAMTGMGDTSESLGRLSRALHGIDSACRPAAVGRPVPHLARRPTLPERRMTAREALRADSAVFGAAEALGRISCEYVYAYPPGIPMIVPGEVIDENVASAVSSGVNVRFSSGHGAGEFCCVI